MKLFFICGFIFYINQISECTQEENITESAEVVAENNTIRNNEDIQEITTFQIPDEKWVAEAVRDIAYYLRHYKFNEWDRRYYSKKPKDELIGFYNNFPVPSLRTLHWKVYENCKNNFFKCLVYLHNVIESSPMSREDDTAVIINENIIPMNESLLQNIDNECHKSVSNAENSGLPFDGPIEKFQWGTTASYYMCWYTMLELPAMSMIGELCDNYASCLDPTFRHQNKDPRADDRVPFACATYSFCPDPCCPKRHIKDFMECYKNKENPCLIENLDGDSSEKACVVHRSENQNFRDIVTNRWNVSCHCNETGFKWVSEFGLCVDINECVTGEHNCDKTTQDCWNLPGSFKCICRWGYGLDKEQKYCTKKTILYKETKFDFTEHYFNLKDYIQRIFNYFNM